MNEQLDFMYCTSKELMQRDNGIIYSNKWIRLVNPTTNFYIIEMKRWFKWKLVHFSPFCPSSVGTFEFKNRNSAITALLHCLLKGKKYTKQGIL